MLYTKLHRTGSSVHGSTDLQAAVRAVVQLDTQPVVHMSIDLSSEPHPPRICSCGTQGHVEFDSATYWDVLQSHKGLNALSYHCLSIGGIDSHLDYLESLCTIYIFLQT